MREIQIFVHGSNFTLLSDFFERNACTTLLERANFPRFVIRKHHRLNQKIACWLDSDEAFVFCPFPSPPCIIVGNGFEQLIGSPTEVDLLRKLVGCYAHADMYLRGEGLYTHTHKPVRCPSDANFWVQCLWLCPLNVRSQVKVLNILPEYGWSHFRLFLVPGYQNLIQGVQHGYWRGALYLLTPPEQRYVELLDVTYWINLHMGILRLLGGMMKHEGIVQELVRNSHEIRRKACNRLLCLPNVATALDQLEQSTELPIYYKALTMFLQALFPKCKIVRRSL